MTEPDDLAFMRGCTVALCICGCFWLLILAIVANAMGWL